MTRPPLDQFDDEEIEVLISVPIDIHDRYVRWAQMNGIDVRHGLEASLANSMRECVKAGRITPRR
ncbi:MAG: hypothetical protein AAF495_25410 [Pseudomonadota bacterium]